MEETTNTQNIPTAPQASQLPVSPAHEPKPRVSKTILAAIIAILLGTLVLVLLQPIKKIRTEAAPTPTPFAQATPTPIRSVSAIATQSAFLALESSIASLSASIQAFSVTDPSLTPPTLDLTLKFNR